MKKVVVFLIFVVFATSGITAQERDRDRIQRSGPHKLDNGQW